jgi:hypothetical protein
MKGMVVIPCDLDAEVELDAGPADDPAGDAGPADVSAGDAGDLLLVVGWGGPSGVARHVHHALAAGPFSVSSRRLSRRGVRRREQPGHFLLVSLKGVLA